MGRSAHGGLAQEREADADDDWALKNREVHDPGMGLSTCPSCAFSRFVKGLVSQSARRECVARSPEAVGLAAQERVDDLDLRKGLLAKCASRDRLRVYCHQNNGAVSHLLIHTSKCRE